MPKIAIITALCGNREALVDPVVVYPDVEYVAFVDKLHPNCNVWHQIPMDKFHSGDKYSDRRNAKIYKVCPHKFLRGGYDYFIWNDVSHNTIMNPNEIIETYLKDSDIGVFKHNQRNCLYDEAKILKELNYDHPHLIDNQVDYYRQCRMPENFGLFELPVSIRRNTIECQRLNELWWLQIETFSSRDQLSFPYCLKALNMKPSILPGFANGYRNGQIGANDIMAQVRHHASSGG